MKNKLKLLGININDEKEKQIFTEAFTHKSYITKKSEQNHNERLEFLGDAVLELITTDFLFHTFPDLPEGDLTNYRSAIVKGIHLGEISRKLELGKFLHLSLGEKKAGGDENTALLANLLEAIIGAIYLTKGFDETKKFIGKYILNDIGNILKNKKFISPKNELQELTQGRFQITPKYKLKKESGFSHEKFFVMEVWIDSVLAGTGEGNSKKIAQEKSAENALENQKKWLKEIKN